MSYSIFLYDHHVMYKKQHTSGFEVWIIYGIILLINNILFEIKYGS